MKKSTNIILGLVLFLILIGSAFAISLIFGIGFVISFVLCIYNGELKRKPWAPIFIFVGALIIRFALSQYLNPVLTSKTLVDLVISAAVFVLILIFGWKIKKS